ncbi:MAG: beta-ketoacyl-ACP synthase II [Planctomycetia bacterium]|nr:beta-ketoacyl-ACP synthase II [Planctomycetia bacterium]
MKRVVVTGIGIISPLGNIVSEFWQNVTHGVCGIAEITKFEARNLKARLAAEVRDFDPLQYMSKVESVRYDPYIKFALAASQQAVEDSGVLGSVSEDRLGVYFGSAMGGFETFAREHGKFLNSGGKRVSPFFVPMMIANMASGLIAERYGCRGFAMPSVTACATGASAIGEACEKIKLGWADAVIAGGSEAAIDEFSLSGFINMKALSTSEDAAGASLPFDLRRNGFVMGEGAAALLLEDYDHAAKRGAKMYGEVCGYGVSCDAYHMASPRPDGEEGARAMAKALRDANWERDEHVYINAHGTGTPSGDIAETRAIRKALANETGRVVVSSTKSMTGHMLGAAGAAEAIVSLLALRDGIIPPTINLREQDPECDLDCTPLLAREVAITLAISNSFGFGGHNVSLALRKVS